MQVLSPSLQPPISLLAKTPLLLDTLLEGLPADLLDWKPSPDRWSITEVLAHLVSIESTYGDRVRVMIMDLEPDLKKYNPPSQDSIRAKSNGDHLREFFVLRRAHLVFLHTIPAGAGSRIGHHPELGAVTVSHMLYELANHDLGHLRQIAELMRARAFYPHAGPFQRYSSPKP